MNIITNFRKNKLAPFTAILRRVARFIDNDVLYVKLLYILEKHQKLDMSNPRTFNEKIQWLKIYNRKSIYTTMVDKYLVKDYVANIIGSKHIIPTLMLYNNINDININELPSQFVLKTTHGGGSDGVIICKNKEKFNLSKAKEILEKSLKKDLYMIHREWVYKDVKKRIIVEKYLAPEKGKEDLTDYKFFCFNGEPKYCQVIRNRNTKETIDFYDMLWNHMPFVGLNPSCKNGLTPVEKPSCLENMIDICRKLADGIPFVRIDLYVVSGNVYFGEITFYPNSGFGSFTPVEWEYKLGELITLPIQK